MARGPGILKLARAETGAPAVVSPWLAGCSNKINFGRAVENVAPWSRVITALRVEWFSDAPRQPEGLASG